MVTVKFSATLAPMPAFAEVFFLTVPQPLHTWLVYLGYTNSTTLPAFMIDHLRLLYAASSITAMFYQVYLSYDFETLLPVLQALASPSRMAAAP